MMVCTRGALKHSVGERPRSKTSVCSLLIDEIVLYYVRVVFISRDHLHRYSLHGLGLSLAPPSPLAATTVGLVIRPPL
ncbi:uncharacterized protein TRIVIDRAFT_212963 [Trichoderma virens Gv29-8]|uniref:Uncharacterized protein n=1 Tax=Hypocrea virens (strain Gv29-8 / FGSC 10586) TaxID=413071 RepID=G9MRI0_HYPVG|nr:uncharacterized protein TRIVIDRAFT_212963 [Trichoderma virens Gv29-8]EHK22701.1 hypothetical protein TRIVIDRAFT_212963 [Trichoderma virens Gv29-8]